jgi:hypothetical protein
MVNGMRLTITFTLAAMSAVFLPGSAFAQDDAPVCPDGYVSYLSAGGWRCGNPIYLDGTWNDDPRDCVYGYYQGSCVPAPTPPEVLPVEAYTYQMDEPDPVYVAEVEAKRLVWLSAVELQLADAGGVR